MIENIVLGILVFGGLIMALAGATSKWHKITWEGTKSVLWTYGFIIAVFALPIAMIVAMMR
jgi:cytochrome c oxidase assembly factor CtaG